MIFSDFDSLHWLIIPAAVVLDAVVGDPRSLPHPIRWMGRAIQFCEPIIRRLLKNQRLAGALFALTLIFGCWWATRLISFAAYRLHPLAGTVTEVILIFFCLSARSLVDAAMEIFNLLVKGHIAAARSALSMIVGRDVDRYDEADIARATVETVAENFVDGVLSPLCFAAVGGAPLAMAYKMINTLDSMVGYKNQRYGQFGWTAARIDDIANFIPARLSVPIIFFATRLIDAPCAVRALTTAISEGAQHSSPNAGYPEAAFAGALAVKLNGPNTYDGVRVDKPYIGKAFGLVNVRHIQKACALMMLSTIITAVMAWIVSLLGLGSYQLQM